MARVSGERFTAQNLADCEFCASAPGERRGFRTTRQCAGCSRYLCLICRPALPGVSFLCPDCGGGPLEDTLAAPHAAIERLVAAGRTVPFWLDALRERLAAGEGSSADDVLVPE